MIYICHYNYDYEESSHAFATRAEALRNIADAFGTESDHDSAEFWEEVDSYYSAGRWKGFTFKMLDPETLRMVDAPQGPESDGGDNPPALDPFAANNLPEAYGYRIDGFRAFELQAPAGLIARARLIDPQAAGWVLWDPSDDPEGLLLVDYDSGVLREEFADYARAHFDPPAPESFPPGTFAPV